MALIAVGVRFTICLPVQLFPIFELLIVRRLVLLPGGEGLGHRVSHSHAVGFPGAVFPKPFGTGGLFGPVCLNLLLRPWVSGEGVLLGVGEVLDFLYLFLTSACRRIW